MKTTKAVGLGLLLGFGSAVLLDRAGPEWIAKMVFKQKATEEVSKEEEQIKAEYVGEIEGKILQLEIGTYPTKLIEGSLNLKKAMMLIQLEDGKKIPVSFENYCGTDNWEVAKFYKPGDMIKVSAYECEGKSGLFGRISWDGVKRE